jgi:hypothetical protein
MTHEFAHLETLERVRRWLIQAGIDPSRIQVHTAGVPRIVVAVEPGEDAEVERVIDAAERGDPDGRPSFWDVAIKERETAEKHTPCRSGEEAAKSESFDVSWQPLDFGREVSQTTTDERIREAYEEQGD